MRFFQRSTPEQEMSPQEKIIQKGWRRILIAVPILNGVFFLMSLIFVWVVPADGRAEMVMTTLIIDAVLVGLSIIGVMASSIVIIAMELDHIRPRPVRNRGGRPNGDTTQYP